MYKLQFLVCLFSVVLLSSLVALVAAQGSRNNTSKWQTLKGDSPLVIARGGFSGIFPDSGSFAYQLAVQLSLPNVVVWCDVQLTKDGVGICFPDLRLENGSNIDHYFKNGRKTYPVNGVPTPGWFSVDFTLNDLEPVNLKQRIYSRAPNFDGTPQQILTVEDVVNFAKPPGLWLNVQHDAFFNQHNLTMRTFIISVSRRVVVNYISSPEVSFLRSIIARFRTSPTKLIFQFLGHDELEPSTNQTYGSLLKNLTFIQTFASGILVPKNYIWPVDNSLYLRPHTSVVSDAHIAGLEVFASTFVNDAPLPYDYSYDPVAEYLNYVDNGNFSVDGVLSDFPITPSEAIVKLLVISSEGASGDYPGCTDKAYSKAISDGVDVLDCPVQLTNDGIPFCLGSINLRDRTNVDETNFSNLATSNPDLNIDSGIYTYNLTWSQIQSTLRPAIYNPFANYSLFRNTKARNDGNFMQLSDFLAIASNASSGLWCLNQYRAEKQGLGVTDAVLDALSKAGYNQTAKKIMIKSSDSAVLKKFKSSSNYERVYMVDEDISDITNSTILGIKNFANSVVITKKSVFPTDKAFVTTQTNVVPKLQAFGFPVYVQFFRNEFASQPWDFFSDAYVEINTHFSGMGINGTITDFPATAAKYRTLAPNPILSENDVVEPPLPPVMEKPPPTTNTGNGSIAPGPTPQNGQPTTVASMILSSIAVLATLLLC
ncbi:Glycerophosphodiester phosphodiesterase GDPDL3 [Abeliophyllum distichum]|uniref:glycerophosphodiester phosphodiesterase n=1 Tax=Abeliophyllum distichum TaxID=126358 RepID=A0ABD1PTI4_9LAMI